MKGTRHKSIRHKGVLRRAYCEQKRQGSEGEIKYQNYKLKLKKEIVLCVQNAPPILLRLGFGGQAGGGANRVAGTNVPRPQDYAPATGI